MSEVRVAVRPYTGEHECELPTCTAHAVAEVALEGYEDGDEVPESGQMLFCAPHGVSATLMLLGEWFKEVAE